jgi:hypothetical protein
VRTGENRHEKQRENKPFEGHAEKEEHKKELEKIERGKEIPNVILSGKIESSDFLTMNDLVRVITSS